LQLDAENIDVPRGLNDQSAVHCKGGRRLPCRTALERRLFISSAAIARFDLKENPKAYEEEYEQSLYESEILRRKQPLQ
jgi:hypothetical protein